MTVPVADEFSDRAEPFRAELLAHCYRMTGSVQDAEDLVQETYLRAWRAYGRFEHRSSVRTWLYRIATNACLTALEHRRRRVLPSGFGPSSADPLGAFATADPGGRWVEPLPEAVLGEAGDPAAIMVERESVRLALVASLQLLSPRQRAVLILRDVLAWPAAQVAEALEMNVGAVKSLLQRARRRLEEAGPEPGDVLEPSHPQARRLVREYMDAFERADPAAFERLLREDAVLETTGPARWFEGRRACVPYLGRVAAGPGEWRILATAANGQPALASYRRDGDRGYRGLGIGVLTVTATGISRVSVFADPALLARCGLPLALPA
ncbi:RNA polymerase subunit sigma-70 [Glycomyces terrestris]|uniref:RNA polymerase sigma factor n=1 Tax=Glycomyces terrestris TaxID=2493553 RepID=A0A426V319_9ACTN|nr:RNA polymerase subunit sigma-70 [Glycomyces terrestris]RRS01262.1 sigma-70 family RNA polymerase sigma factor [Glycomyces terrestris]